MKKLAVLLLPFIWINSNTIFCQNVGIGITNPTRAKLEVYGAVGQTSAIISGVSFQRNPAAIGFNQYITDQARYLNTGKASILWMGPSNGSLYYDLYNTSGSANNPALNPARGLTIKWNGDVSFNAGEANASLFVGYTATNYITRFQGTTYHSQFNVAQDGDGYTRISGGKSGSDVYINDANTGSIYLMGYVGVNTDVLGSRHLEIRQLGGRGLALVEPSTFHNWEFVTTKNLTDPASDYYVYYNGAYRGNFFYVDGGYYPISDTRLKKNIAPLTGALEKLLRLSPVCYHMEFLDSDSLKTIGLLAQEVKKIFPELVEHVTDTPTGYPGLNEIYTMNYDGLTPIIIKAINEQQDKIAALRSRNEILRKKIETIEKLNKE